MSYLLTLGILAVLATLFLFRRRSTAGQVSKAKPASVEDSRLRREKEEELLKRLSDLRKKRQDAVASAVDEDPQRAARVVRRMMKDKG